MTFSPTTYRPLLVVTAAFIWSLATIGSLVTPTAAYARGGDVVYTAQLAEPMKSEVIVAGGVAWICGGTTCTASKARSRPEIMCRKLVRKTGPVTAFTYKDRTLSEAKIAKCNG